MSAQHARPPIDRADLDSVLRLANRPKLTGALREVVAMERLLKRALGPVAREVRDRHVEFVCEVLPNVGYYVLGETRWLMEVIAGAARGASKELDDAEVCLRLARQMAGFEPSETVLLSVVVRDGTSVEEILHVELALPGCGEEHAANDVEGARMLVVTPSADGARVHGSAMRRFGVEAATVMDGASARDQLRAATRDGKSFDVVFIDDALREGVVPLVEALRSDASLGHARSIVATSMPEGPKMSALVAAAPSAVLTKPILPDELAMAVAALRADKLASKRHPVDPTKIAAALVSSAQTTTPTSGSGTYRLDVRAAARKRGER